MTYLGWRISVLDTLVRQASDHLGIHEGLGSEVRCKADAVLADPSVLECGPVEKVNESDSASKDAEDSLEYALHHRLEDIRAESLRMEVQAD